MLLRKSCEGKVGAQIPAGIGNPSWLPCPKEAAACLAEELKVYGESTS